MNAATKQKMVLDEIAGKNNAIQHYDQRLWQIRSGYMTLLFAGWGALLSFFGDSKELILPFAYGMLFVSFGLSFAGAYLDLVHVRRKFRCIKALELLMQDAYSHIEEPDEFDHKDKWLHTSGDDMDIEFCKDRGYRRARFVPIVVYLVPLISILAGVITLALILPRTSGQSVHRIDHQAERCLALLLWLLG